MLFKGEKVTNRRRNRYGSEQGDGIEVVGLGLIDVTVAREPLKEVRAVEANDSVVEEYSCRRRQVWLVRRDERAELH